MRVTRADERISEFPKPGLEIVDNVAFGSSDTLIMCAGFEDRSINVAKHLARSGANGVDVILISYLPMIGENRESELLELCKTRSCTVKELIYNRHEPAGFAEKAMESVKNRTNRVWLDISGMTRLLITQLVAFLCQEPEWLRKTTVLYSEADQYLPTRDEAKHNLDLSEESAYIDFSFLSSGIYDLAALPELATVAVGDSPSYLVAFPSFNPAQLAAVVENSPPSKVTLVHGIPPRDELGWRADVIRRMNRMPEGPEIDDVTLSTLYYQETFECLAKLYGDISPYYGIVISPTGSKMQALAVGLFRGFFKDVQIVFPTHNEFTDPRSYTTGVRSMYSLELSGYGVLRSQLRKEYQGF